MLAIVLRTVDYKDTDRMVTLFARDHGRIDALARGCKKPSAKLHSASEQFCCGEYAFNESGGRKYMAQCDIKSTFFNISGTIESFAVASALIEVTDKAVMYGEGNPRLFALLVNCLYALNEDNSRAEEVLAFFTVKLLDILGLRPDFGACCICGAETASAYDCDAQGAVCENCRTEESYECIPIMDRILNMTSKQIISSKIDAEHSFVVFCVNILENLTECRIKSLRLITHA